MRRWPNVGLLLGQRRRRWANSKPTLGQRLMFPGDRSIMADTNMRDIFSENHNCSERKNTRINRQNNHDKCLAQ